MSNCGVLLLMSGISISEITSSTECLLGGVSTIKTVGKFTAIWIYSTDLRQLYNNLKELGRIQLKDSRTKDVIEDAQKRAWSVAKVFLWIFGTTMSGTVLTSFLRTLRRPSRPVFPLKIWVPVDPASSRWALWGDFLWQVAPLSVSLPAICLEYILISLLVILIAAQIEILLIELRRFGYSSTESTSHKQYLVNCIRHHQYIIRMVKNYNKIFCKILLFDVLMSSAQVCLVAYQCMRVPMTDMKQTQFIPFFLSSAFTPFAVCFAGEYLKTKSSLIVEAAFSSGWYQTRVPLHRDLLVLIMAATRPLTINVGGCFVIQLTMFEKTIQTAYSYLALLRTME